jgi:hypothetical protein
MPLFRNTKDIDIKTKIIDVEYVAICSAVIRVSALKDVGLMDERFFIFWDDMEWGLQFKKMNYRVVAVLTSVAYHNPFTEKRNPMIDFYYGKRNAMLTYAKHFNPYNRNFLFYKYVRYIFKLFIFFGLTHRPELMLLGFSGVFDFMIGRWGKKEIKLSKKKNLSYTFSNDIQKVILLLHGGDKESIIEILSKLKTLMPNNDFTLLIDDDRLDFYKSYVTKIVTIKRAENFNLKYVAINLFKILFKKYDLAINLNYQSPFSFAVKEVCSYDSASGEFYEDNNNLKNSWKLLTSVAAGELLAVLLTPFIFVKSLTYYYETQDINKLKK